MHTSPFCLLNLTETCTDYNRGGIDALCFNLQPFHMNGIRRMVGAQFRVVRKIKAECGFRYRSARLNKSSDRTACFVLKPHREYPLRRRVSPAANRIAVTTPRRLGNDGQTMASRAMTGKAMAASKITGKAMLSGNLWQAIQWNEGRW
jgi:hypothetical protein